MAVTDLFSKASDFINENLSNYGLDTNVKNYIKNQLPNIVDATEQIQSMQVPQGYKVDVVYSGDTGVGVGTITATIPKEIVFDFKSRWSALANPGKHEVVNTLSVATTGKQLTNNQNFSIQVWGGTEPLKMSLELNFVANNSAEAYTKIILPIQKLAALVLPTASPSGFLTPPGPFPYEIAGESSPLFKGTKIDIRIGDFMYLNDVIIENCRVSIPSIFGDVNADSFENSKLIDDAIKGDIKGMANTYISGLLNSGKNSVLMPTRAKCIIGISTLSALTSDAIARMISGREQSKVISTTLDQFTSEVKEMGSKFVDSVSNVVGNITKR